MLDNCSLIICGPLINRISEEKLIESFALLKRLELECGLEIIISTYKSEITGALASFNFKTIINNDPGSDSANGGLATFGLQKKITTRNTTRMLTTTLAGLSQANRPIVIKTRVEILPENMNFAEALHHTIQNLNEHVKIIFLSEHYFGPLRDEKPVLAWLPDTFQIMKTKDSIKLWSAALDIWQVNKKFWLGKRLHCDITNEQILGLSYQKIFLNHSKPKITKNFHRFKFNLSLFNLAYICETEQYKSVNFADMFLTTSRLMRFDRFFSVNKLSLPNPKINKTLLLIRYILKRLHYKNYYFYIRAKVRIYDKLYTK